jgi:peptidyl-tRNA hydrolase
MARLNISVREDIKKGMKEAAAACCGGNVSAYVQKMHLDGGENYRLSKAEFARVIREELEKFRESLTPSP